MMFILALIPRRLIAYHTYTYETAVRSRLADNSNALGRPITTLASILDLEHGSSGIFNASSRAYIARATAIDSAHYPETLGKMLIINAPGFFAMIWKVIRCASRPVCMALFASKGLD